MNSYQHSKRSLKTRQSFSFLLLFSAACHPVHATEDIDLKADLAWLGAEKIEVVSKQKENKNSAAGIVSIVSQDDIKRYGGNNLFDVLNRVTSIYMLSSYIWSNGTASMRGDLFTHVNNHILILINGRPFRDSAYGGLTETAFRDFPIHHVEQIEVIRGAGSVLYGTNAFAGVINIVTKKQQEDSVTIRGRYGSFNTGQAETEFALKGKEASLTGAVRYKASNGWLSSALDEKGKNISFRNNDGDVSASLYGQWQDVSFNAFVVNNKHNHWGSLPVGNGQPIENNRLFLDLGYKKQINSNWLAQANLTYNKFTQEYNLPVNGAPYLTHLYENNILFEQSNFFNFFDNSLNLTFGGLVEYQEGGVKQNQQPNTLAPYTYLKASLYGEGSYRLLDNLKLTAGGQWQYFESLGSSMINIGGKDKPITGMIGRLGLVYNMSENFGFKLLYSQAFRSAGAGELGANSALVLGNPSLQAENIETVDAQVFFNSKTYQASLTAFRSRESNLITRSPIPGSNPVRLQYVNGGSAVFSGLEFESKATLFNAWHWQGAYTFQTNRDGNGQNNATLAPNHIAKMGLSYDVTPDLQISVFDTFFSKAKVFPTAAQVNPPAASYHHITLNSNYRLDHLIGSGFAKHVTFSFYLDNLLNEKFYYPEFNRKRVNTMPASPGRSLFGELSIEF